MRPHSPLCSLQLLKITHPVSWASFVFCHESLHVSSGSREEGRWGGPLALAVFPFLANVDEACSVHLVAG